MRAHSALILATGACVVGSLVAPCAAHGTVVSPASRVYRVYKSNPERPSFPLAANAVRRDGKQSYYTWNELSRNIPEAVKAGLKPGFDYSRWVPDGQLASGGRVDPRSKLYPRTYAGLDQVSAAWPKTSVVAGQSIVVDFLATAPHNPSVWDVWMTKPGWKPTQKLAWKDMEFLGRPTVSFVNRHYKFRLKIPADRSGHHVLWVAWQRNDPVGEVFFSTSDLDVRHTAQFATYGQGCAGSDRRVPTLASSRRPILGSRFSLTLDRAAPKSFAALLLGDRVRVDLGTAAPGCTLLATPSVVVPVGPWAGKALVVPLALPADRRFAGVRVGSQFLIADPGVTRPLTLALSNGGLATLGVQ